MKLKNAGNHITFWEVKGRHKAKIIEITSKKVRDMELIQGFLKRERDNQEETIKQIMEEKFPE